MTWFFYLPRLVLISVRFFNAIAVEVNVNESPVHLTLCDTAGQDTLDPLRELSYPDSDVFLLCFSVVKPETFGAIKSKWAPKFAKTKAALILVGTQADLRSNLNVLNKSQVSFTFSSLLLFLFFFLLRVDFAYLCALVHA